MPLITFLCVTKPTRNSRGYGYDDEDDHYKFHLLNKIIILFMKISNTSLSPVIRIYYYYRRNILLDLFFSELTACCSWSHGLWPKISFKLVWRCHQLRSGFLANVHLSRVSRKLVLPANDRVIMRCYRGLSTNNLAYFIIEENPGKPQLGDRG